MSEQGNALMRSVSKRSARNFVRAALTITVICLVVAIPFFSWTSICFEGVRQPSNRDFFISAYLDIYPNVLADDIDFLHTNAGTIATSNSGGKIDFWGPVSCRFNVFSSRCVSLGPNINAVVDGDLKILVFDKCGRVSDMPR